jgi:choline dehydrogenase-like flavoprotein
MILKVDALPNDATIDTDVCVIGAGASGISLARELAGTSADVVLLESGDLDVNEAYEELNDGTVDGRDFTGLRAGRRRGFGGTTAAWGGQCCEFDAEDFVSRSWIPNSGWPIGLHELVPYYRRAERILSVSGQRYDERNWLKFGLKPVKLNADSLRTSFSVFSPRPRLGTVYRAFFRKAKNVRVILGATATNLGTNANASRATVVDVRSVGGQRAQVRARAFVICTGTIESARLLLSSRDVAPNGLGNDHDLVGRYFQDHPTADTAAIETSRPVVLQDLYSVLYRGRTWYWPKMALAPARQRAANSLNACAFLTIEYESSAIEILRQMIRTTKTGGRFDFSAAQIAALAAGMPAVVDAAYRRYLRGRSPRAKPSRMDLTCSIEQAPNPDSRVTLADSRDRFGIPQARVQWKITQDELHAFRVITESVGEEFARLGLGTLVPKPWLATSDLLAWPIWDNYHQTGTTRMSGDPTKGVVDPNGQVHGVEGLFVAGAPTFPTGGYANPVLTIVALSVRLSDRLKTVLRL